ncbi:MAG: PorT family protein [Bacteroidales bacterium]|nr:PorT family protein [Bacteroidales bacterium]
MKKLHLLLVFSLAITCIAHAQKGKEVILGAGGAFTNVWILKQNFYGEPEIDYAPKTGYAFNANLGYSFTEQISAIVEIQYSRQGQKYEGRQGSFTKAERDINLNYLNIPLFFKYSFGSGGTRFRFLAGPQFSSLLSADQTYERDGNVIGTKKINLDGEEFVTDAEDIKDRWESSYFGVALDVGADIYLNKNFFVNAGMRINYGFKDINAPAYRLPAYSEPYEASHNLWGGLYVGINYLLDVEGYKQRSF